MAQNPIRIVLAKVGLDGHDRGVKVVARALRDAGLHVIYAGLWLTPEAVVRAVADEDADWLGLSLLSGAHMTLVPRVLELMKQGGLEDVGLIVGGIIPELDVPKLKAMGVARVFGPGTSLPEIVDFVKRESEARHAATEQSA
jgi:methylmalonyl-CoA mutase cobalamin-binding domain/chain